MGMSILVSTISFTITAIIFYILIKTFLYIRNISNKVDEIAKKK